MSRRYPAPPGCISRAPGETFDTPALQARREALRQGKAQVRPALLDAPEPPARKRPRQPPHDRLDFRKFGHGGEANAFRAREKHRARNVATLPTL